MPCGRTQLFYRTDRPESDGDPVPTTYTALLREVKLRYINYHFSMLSLQWGTGIGPAPPLQDTGDGGGSMPYLYVFLKERITKTLAKRLVS